MQIKGRAEALSDAGAPARLREVVCEQGSSGGQWSRPSRRASDMGGLRLMIANVGGETGSTGSMACRAGAAAADLGWAGGATAARWPLPVDHHLSARPQRWARVETLSSKACRHGRACAGARATASVFLLPSPVRPPASRKSCCYTAATYTTSTPSRPSHLTQPDTPHARSSCCACCVPPPPAIRTQICGEITTTPPASPCPLPDNARPFCHLRTPTRTRISRRLGLLYRAPGPRSSRSWKTSPLPHLCCREACADHDSFADARRKSLNVTCAHELILGAALWRRPHTADSSPAFSLSLPLFIFQYHETPRHAPLPTDCARCRGGPHRSGCRAERLGRTEPAVLLQPEHRIGLQPWYVARRTHAGNENRVLTCRSERYRKLLQSLFGSMQQQLRLCHCAMAELLVLRLHPR